MSQSNFFNEEPDYVSISDNAKGLDHIPSDMGKPIIGHTFSYVADPMQVLGDLYKNHGPVVKSSFTFQEVIVALGPEFIQQVTLDSEKAFSTRMGYEPALKHFFEGGLLMRDFDAHKFHRRIMQTAFKNDAMRNYIGAMNPLIEKATDSWANDSNFHFYPNIKTLLLDIGAKVFLGLDLADGETDRLNKAFLAMGDGTLAIVRKDWPLPWLKYRRGMNGRRYLDQFFLDLVPQKRGQEGADMATYFANETTEEGEHFPADTVSKHLIFLLLAAHDTTTSALTMASYYLAAHPEWQEQLRTNNDIMQGSHLSYEELAQVPDIENTFKEAERLHPSVPAFMRRTVKEVEMGGFLIPAHTPIQVSPTFVHRMPEWWGDNANGFDPGRFARNEHKKHSFQWAPFGGGAHKCIGLHFADMLFKCVMSNMLKKYRIKFAPGYQYPTAIQHFPFAKTKDNLPLILEKI